MEEQLSAGGEPVSREESLPARPVPATTVPPWAPPPPGPANALLPRRPAWFREPRCGIPTSMNNSAAAAPSGTELPGNKSPFQGNGSPVRPGAPAVSVGLPVMYTPDMPPSPKAEWCAGGHDSRKGPLPHSEQRHQHLGISTSPSGGCGGTRGRSRWVPGREWPWPGGVPGAPGRRVGGRALRVHRYSGCCALSCRCFNSVRGAWGEVTCMKIYVWGSSRVCLLSGFIL